VTTGIIGGDGPGLVVLVGRVDSGTTAAVRERLHAAVAAGSGMLVIDLTGVSLIDVTGLGVLVGTQRLAERSGRTVVLRGTSERLSRLLRVTGLDRVLPTVPGPSRPAAVPPAPARQEVPAA
jgi:anti-sigma B factor antagonist